MKLSLKIVFFLGWCIKLGRWIKFNMLDLFTVTCPWLLTVIISSGWVGTGSTTGLTSADIRKSRTLVWFPNPLATDVRWGPCAGEHLTNTPLLGQWKNTIRDGSRNALWTVYTVYTAHTTYTAYIASTAHTVYTVQTALEQKGYFAYTSNIAKMLYEFQDKKTGWLGDLMGDTPLDS